MSHTLETAEWVVAPEIRDAEHTAWLAQYEATFGPRPSDARPLPIRWA